METAVLEIVETETQAETPRIPEEARTRGIAGIFKNSLIGRLNEEQQSSAR